MIIDSTQDNAEAGKRWLAVYCKPRQELVAQENLLRQGYHTYLPRIQMKRRLRGKWNEKIEALFPRYIFIRVDPVKKSIAPVRSTQGVVGLVHFGSQPATVSEAVMETLLQHEDPDSGLHQGGGPQFNAGQSIKLVDGPLAGMEGVFIQQDSEKRVMVLLDFLGKANKVRIDRDLINQAA